MTMMMTVTIINWLLDDNDQNDGDDDDNDHQKEGYWFEAGMMTMTMTMTMTVTMTVGKKDGDDDQREGYWSNCNAASSLLHPVQVHPQVSLDCYLNRHHHRHQLSSPSSTVITVINCHQRHHQPYQVSQ